jgi:dihydrofolate reductase
VSDAAPPLVPGQTMLPPVSLIAAVPRNGAIGRGNALLWHESADQRHFRQTTQGHPVLMGRRTWDSLPERFRPLPGRRNVVLSRNAAWQAPGAEVLPGLLPALQLLGGAEAPRVFVIGGAELYRQALPLADELVLTEIDADLDGDVFFPAFDRRDFDADVGPMALGSSGLNYRFVTYRRRSPLANRL